MKTYIAMFFVASALMTPVFAQDKMTQDKMTTKTTKTKKMKKTDKMKSTDKTDKMTTKM